MWKGIKTFGRAFYQAGSAVSFVTWLWGLPWAAGGAVIAGWIARAEHLPPVIIAIVAFAAAVLVYVLYVAILFHRRSPSEVQAESPEQVAPPAPAALQTLPALEKLFFGDFETGPKGAFLQVTHEQGLVLGEADAVTIKYLVVLLYDAHAKVLAVYIPPTPHTMAIAHHVCNNVESYVEVEGIDPAVGGVGHEEVRASELIFTRKVFIYHETTLTLSERGQLDSAYRDKGLWLQLRSTEYALNTQESQNAKSA